MALKLTREGLRRLIQSEARRLRENVPAPSADAASSLDDAATHLDDAYNALQRAHAELEETGREDDAAAVTSWLADVGNLRSDVGMLADEVREEGGDGEPGDDRPAIIHR
jgi:hypothetical protein